MPSLFGGVSSLEDCSLGTAKRNPGPHEQSEMRDGFGHRCPRISLRSSGRRGLSAASRFARVRGAGFCLLQKFTRPALPALGHLGNRKQAIGFMAIAGKDTEYVSNREIMIGALDDPDLIAGTDITLGDDAQIRPGP